MINRNDWRIRLANALLATFMPDLGRLTCDMSFADMIAYSIAGNQLEIGLDGFNGYGQPADVRQVSHLATELAIETVAARGYRVEDDAGLEMETKTTTHDAAMDRRRRLKQLLAGLKR